jgi:hypothetical protein
MTTTWKFLAVTIMTACVSTEDSASEERGPLGKADGTGSCVGHCGEKSAGTCWCDDQCADFGDCCSDKALVCDGAEPSGFVAIDAGIRHTCALRDDGSIACWGLDNTGQTKAPAGTFSSVSAWSEHSCAVDAATQQITCWGGSTFKPSGTFLQVSTGGSGNQPETCGLRTNGQIVCIGSENSRNFLSPPYVRVEAAYPKICAIRSTGRIDCRGRSVDAPTNTFKTYSVNGASHLTRECGVRTDDTLQCTIAGAPTGTFKDVRVGPTHACGLRTDGTLACWGSNTRGESTPPAGTFIAVDVGHQYSCAIRSDGTIACFGTNDFGQSTPPQ